METINYCNKCGRKLIRTEEPNGFDTETGEQKTRILARCPLWNTWRDYDPYDSHYAINEYATN